MIHTGFFYVIHDRRIKGELLTKIKAYIHFQMQIALYGIK